MQSSQRHPHHLVLSRHGEGRPAFDEASRDARRRPILFSRVERAVRALVDESGSATAEYAVATMAAVGFAGLLVLILRGDEVRGILTGLVRKALTVAD
ncbi:DUF4244 domain-containing protein [Humibacter ginsenosidimutans]|uniref:DUF4244 domain-containing protein n=1 Tax=Humibacter ginsenosidimutans TaxID=2599293 RepID=A0A5B8M8H9_9MICO|nr:DUF4244 domain-containing protein [Humibacter ginsenosidimutans]